MRRVSKKKARALRDYEKARAVVIARSGGLCEVMWDHGCRGVGVHVHHRLPRSAGGPDTAENCVMACLWCHQKVHANPTEAYERGWLISRYAS